MARKRRRQSYRTKARAAIRRAKRETLGTFIQRPEVMLGGVALLALFSTSMQRR